MQNSNENTCARVSFLIKLQASRLTPATLLKKRLWHTCFPVNFAKFIRTPFLQNTFKWVLATSFKSSVIRQKGESQNGGNKKIKHAKFSKNWTFLTPWYADVRARIRGKKCLFFWKIWRAFFSCYLRFEILPFALSPTKYPWFSVYIFSIMLLRKVWLINKRIFQTAIWLLFLILTILFTNLFWKGDLYCI